VPCPANAAKALIKLGTMDLGEQIEIWLKDGEPVQNLVPALEEAGHRILERRRLDDTHWCVLVEVGA
jgi:tRNA 2-thiouridine synthesizing protein A